MQAGHRVDVIGHTWDDMDEASPIAPAFLQARLETLLLSHMSRLVTGRTRRHHLRDRVRVLTSAFRGSACSHMPFPRDLVETEIAFSPGAFCSKQAVLPYLDDDASMVLLTRWDVVFYTPVELDLLSSNLFYVTNWCRAVGAAHSQNSRAWGLERFGLCADTHGMPDWLFMATPKLMHLFFGNLVGDLCGGAFRVPGFRVNDSEAACHTNHAVIVGRALQLGKQGLLKMGRYLYHMMDYDFVRTARAQVSYSAHVPGLNCYHTEERTQCINALTRPEDMWLIEPNVSRVESKLRELNAPTWMHRHLQRINIFVDSRKTKLWNMHIPTLFSRCHPAIALLACPASTFQAFVKGMVTLTRNYSYI
jgi:hypothetical protein